MDIHRTGTALALVAFLAACSGEESRWAGSISDSAGVTIVSNTDVGIWAAGEEWRLEEELRIGALEGDSEYQFGEVGGVAVDSRGRIFVLDSQAQHVQVYSPDGVYEQTVGGRGSGPGELQTAIVLLTGPGDTLLIPDGQNLRFNRYAPDGSSAGGIRMVLEEGRPMAFRSTAGGLMAEQRRPLMLPGEPALENPTDLIVLLATDGSIADTLMSFASGELLSSTGVRVYGREAVWDLADDSRLLFGINDDYRISLYSDGEMERVITKSFERKSVSDEDREAVMSFLRGRWNEAGLPPARQEQLANRFSFADYLPALQNVFAGPEGTIWVQLVKPASELSENEIDAFTSAGQPDWDVFDSEGRFLGTVTIPSQFRAMLFRGDKIYGVWLDELDVQYVVRFRIVDDPDRGAT